MINDVQFYLVGIVTGVLSMLLVFFLMFWYHWNDKESSTKEIVTLKEEILRSLKDQKPKKEAL